MYEAILKSKNSYLFNHTHFILSGNNGTEEGKLILWFVIEEYWCYGMYGIIQFNVDGVGGLLNCILDGWSAYFGYTLLGCNVRYLICITCVKLPAILIFMHT